MNLQRIEEKLLELDRHPLYSFIDSKDKLRFFMERHVYAVFDFMSLAKTLQHHFAPSSTLWLPPKNKKLARFINEIILCEETDQMKGESLSHFEMYCLSMNEIKANSDGPMSFVRVLEDRPIMQVLNDYPLPESARAFMRHTFTLLKVGQTHEVAAAFCFGREKVIPSMFQRLLDEIKIDDKVAPSFHYYLKRHIEVDGDEHGPMSELMLATLCEEDSQLWDEAEASALSSLNARLTFWDQVMVEYENSQL